MFRKFIYRVVKDPKFRFEFIIMTTIIISSLKLVLDTYVTKTSKS